MHTDHLEEDHLTVIYLSQIGGLCGGSRMAALKEGSRLASVQEHLHGVVCDGSHLWSDQCCCYGYLRPRHPVSIQLHPKHGEEEKKRSDTHSERKE